MQAKSAVAIALLSISAFGSAFASGCAVTPIKVLNGGVPVAGADVYANGTLLGRTANNGMLFVAPLASGTTLVARKEILERPGYRPNHGPENGGNGWTERVYITSIDVNNDGTVSTFSVTAPSAEQDVSVKNDNTLMGLHFLASLDWDAAQSELDDLSTKMTQASNYMYNASDGQMYFEQIDIIDDGTFYGDAEYVWNADINQWPHTNGLAGFFGRNWFGLQNTAFMSRRTDLSLNTFQVIDHEFGHLAYGVQDEYAGVWVPPSSNFCASKIKDVDPVFGGGGPKASCVMDDEWNATKYCSGHPDNQHRNLLWQPGPCWDTLVAGLQDNQNPARWTLKTPTTRNAIPGTLPPLPTQWQPRVNVVNTHLPNLCMAFPVHIAQSNGQPAVNQNVVLILAGSGINVHEGPTDGNGNITIVGAHTGDQLQFNGSWTVPACPTTT